LKHLESLYTFTDKSGQVPDKLGQVVLADFEQQFIPALALASTVMPHAKKNNK